jgi:hypothetical protein
MAEVPTSERTRVLPASDDETMRETARRAAWFFVWSVFFSLTLGATLGTALWLSLTLQTNLLGPLAPGNTRLAHGYAQVFGFAALFVCGVAYHVLPRLSGRPWHRSPLLSVTLWGLVLGAATASLAALFGAHWRWLLLGHLGLVTGASAFAWTITTHLRGARVAVPLPAYLQLGCWWLVGATAAPLLFPALLVHAHNVLWEAVLWGFATNWIYGMSLRILPAALGLPWQSQRADWLVLALHQLAVASWCTGVAGTELGAGPAATISLRVGGILLAVAVAAYVYRAGFLQTVRVPVAHPMPGTEKFLVAAYGWLGVAAVCAPLAVGSGLAPHTGPAFDFARHAFTIGFLTQMIVGVSMRVIPTAAGIPIWSERLRDATFFLLNVAVVLRAGEAAAAWGGNLAWYHWSALSGPIAWSAFVAFAWNLIMSVRQWSRNTSNRSPDSPPERAHGR